MVSEPVTEKFGTKKSPGTGLEKYLVPKKVLEPVPEKFEKKSRNRYRSDFGSRHTLIIREHSFMSDMLCVEFEVVLLAWAGQLIRFYTILYLDSLKDA